MLECFGGCSGFGVFFWPSVKQTPLQMPARNKKIYIFTHFYSHPLKSHSNVSRCLVLNGTSTRLAVTLTFNHVPFQEYSVFAFWQDCGRFHTSILLRRRQGLTMDFISRPSPSPGLYQPIFLLFSTNSWGEKQRV